ncbi:MAG: tetratricopeptide repeat protein [Planctomycetaceae bacterium]
MSDRPVEAEAEELQAGSPVLQGERVAFTGTLASMTHREAHKITAQHGGAATSDVSRQTTMLVVGEEGWPLEADGKPSQKWQHAAQLRNEGVAIRILNESDWLHLVNLDGQRQEAERLYTPAMLSELLDVSASTIRSWERVGLIRPVRKVYRLPYFDFQEVSSARRIVALLAAGVSRKELEESLETLRSVLKDVDRPLAQLEMLAQDSRLLYRDEIGLIEPRSGQRQFDFEPTKPPDEPTTGGGHFSNPWRIDHKDRRVHWTTDEWFHEGCRQLEQNDPAAVESFRMCLMEKPGDPELNFFLAEALYRSGKLDGAVERYYAAVEADHNYLEAWTQLGCLHSERGELQSALDAFDIALDLHPEYPDAHWQKADVLGQLNRTVEAIPHWRKYLEHDSRGPWAEQARQRLLAADRSEESSE